MRSIRRTKNTASDISKQYGNSVSRLIRASTGFREKLWWPNGKARKRLYSLHPPIQPLFERSPKRMSVTEWSSSFLSFPKMRKPGNLLRDVRSGLAKRHTCLCRLTRREFPRRSPEGAFYQEKWLNNGSAKETPPISGIKSRRISFRPLSLCLFLSVSPPCFSCSPVPFYFYSTLAETLSQAGFE